MAWAFDGIWAFTIEMLFDIVAEKLRGNYMPLQIKSISNSIMDEMKNSIHRFPSIAPHAPDRRWVKGAGMNSGPPSDVPGAAVRA
jgi:hypothetical protein